MKRRVFVLIFTFFITLTDLLAQARFNSNIAAGNWGSAASWTIVAGTDANGIPDADDTVIVLNGHTINITSNSACYNLTENGSGVINFNTDNVTLAVGGDYTVTGSDAMGGGGGINRVMTVAGNFIVTNTSTASDIVGIDFTVSGTTTISGYLEINGNTGVKVFTGDVAHNTGGTIYFNVVETISMLGNLVDEGHMGGSINAGVVTVAGNLTINAATTASFGSLTLTINGISTINGTLSFLGSVNGTKTLVGDVTFNNGSALSYVVAETLDLTNAANFNGNVTISGASTGGLNIGGAVNIAAGGVVSMGSVGLTVTGLTTIDGTVSFTNNLGTKSFTSVTITATGNWDCSLIDELFIFNGVFTNNGLFSASASSAAASEYRFNNTSSLVGIFTIPNLSVNTGTLTNNGTVTITNNMAGAGTFTQATGKVLNYSSTTNAITPTLSAAAVGNIVNYDGAGAQTVASATYSYLRITNTGNKTLAGAIVVGKDLTIENASSLDVSIGNFNVTVRGSWLVTSTDPDPFREQQGRVIFSGTTATQTISNPLLIETFYRVTFQGSSALNPTYDATVDIDVNSAITFTSGVLQMNGYDLTLTMAGVGSVFTAGKIISNAATTDFIVSDPANIRRIDFDGTQFGDTSFGLTTDVTAFELYLDGSTFYGVESFTRTGTTAVNCLGGNVFYGSVSINTTTASVGWRLANNQPDTFYNATITHLGISGNLVLGAQTLNNVFYGITSIYTNASSGIYFTISNGSTSARSCIFKGPVNITVALTGTVFFAEGGGTMNQHCEFESTIQCNSLSSSTGDIRFGVGALSTVTLTSTANFINGTVTGQTSIVLRKLTQLGTLSQDITTTGVNSLINCSSGAQFCTFNGPVNFNTKRIISNSARYNNNVVFNITDTIEIRYNRFNGAANSITFSGPSGSTNNNGGNIFAAGTSTTITSSGVADLNMGSFTPDDFNGDVTFVQTGTGILYPAQHATLPSTFAGNVSTSGSTAIVTFTRAKFDGSTTQTITGPAAFAPRFTNIEIASTAPLPSISIMVNNVFFTTGTVTFTSGTIDLNGNTLIMGTASNNTGTLVHTSGYFFNGTFRRWMNGAILAMGSSRGLFPMGTNQNDYRPLWVAYSTNLNSGGTLLVSHTANYPSLATAITPYTDASWGNSVVGVSNSNWRITLNNGFALNGTSGSVRFGGDGFGGYFLSDLNASLATNTVGTYSAATNTVVPLEVTRTGLTTANLTRTWYIGTRNIIASPLPVTWLDFTAEAGTNQVNLQWATASELNNDFFLVQRSVDGINFESIGVVDGMGTSSTVQNYSFIDTEPLKGLIYYRLRQTDFNGQYEYSDIVTVTLNGVTGIDAMIYPNPGDGINTTIMVSSSDEENVIVEVFNASGDLVYQNKQTINGQYQFQIPDHLATGMYMVTITSSSDRIVRRIIVH